MQTRVLLYTEFYSCCVSFCVLTSYECNRCPLVAWLSGNALVSINVVTLSRARLVLGWVTVCDRVNHLGM